MGTISVDKLGALSLIAGPVLAFVFFLIQPGGVLIESADLSDHVGSITAAASNVWLSNITALVIALGLVMTTYGLYVVQIGIRGGGNGDALSRAGLILIVFGNVGWVLAQGLTFIMADAQIPEALQAMVPVYTVKSGIVMMSGVAVSLGFLVFSLALSTRDDFNKIAAWIVALASLVAMVGYIVAISDPGQVDTAISVARVCYVAWVIWPIMLGVGLLKAEMPASAGE